MQWQCSLCSLRMFRQGTRVVVSKLVTTQASAAQQRLSGFKITLRISAAHLQYDDTDCRRALRAFRWAIYKRAHKPTACPVAPSHVLTSLLSVQGRSQFLLSWHRKKMPAVVEKKILRFTLLCGYWRRPAVVTIHSAAPGNASSGVRLNEVFVRRRRSCWWPIPLRALWTSQCLWTGTKSGTSLNLVTEREGSPTS